ncbi:hypothetical protein ABFW14_21480, partial [Mycolicibacterium fortuitum]|uniref:DEAD/DEAH box helicase n=1 Tax=Mycolicibacterium TaxID=1866885 RepID=UPI001B3359BD
LDTGLWDRLQRPKPSQFPGVRELPVSSRIDELADTATATVFVGTFQKALRIQAELDGDPVRRDACFAGFNAVLVDEGHYEPSPQWSCAIRSLGLPVVLFTATPYRNDELHFDAEPSHRYWYRHHQAEADERLREPRFVTLSKGRTEQFIDDTLDFVAQKRLDAARIIIRCKDAPAIQACVAALRDRNQSVIGIHETFTRTGDPTLTNHLPAPHDTDAQYWVHQFKLLEGIDDPSFRVVAFHDTPGNDRSVVQQIGRILRRPTPAPKIAWVLSRQGSDAAATWSRYLQFDKLGGQSLATAPDFTQCLLGVQPAAAYFDQQFRTPIDLSDPDLWQQFAYQPAARVYQRPPTLPSPAELGETIVADYQSMGRSTQAPMFPDADTVVVGYVSIGNSDALLNGLFLQGDLGFTVIRLTTKRLYVFDSHNHLPDAISALSLRQETRPTLSILLDPATRLTSVSLDNTDLGKRAIRSRAVRAASIEDVAPDLTDYAYVCNVAEGYTPNSPLGDKTRRYLGISRARIRDGRAQRMPFEQYRDWVETIDHLLDDDHAQASATLDRYAAAAEQPVDPTPAHLLIDVDVADFARTDDDGTTTELHLDDAATTVHDGELTLQVGGTAVPASLHWDATEAKYHFESSALRRLNFLDTTTERELTATINAGQRMRIVPQTPGSIYVHGQFLAAGEPHTGLPGQRLLKLVTGMSQLKDIKIEKGDPVGDRWAPNSVFEVIDKLVRPERDEIPEMSRYFDHLDTLICTDLRTEPCDFIAMQPDRIAFIHAKYGEGKKRSASVFHDVVGQAIKNITYLLASSQTPLRIDYWDTPWSTDKSSGKQVTRLRTPRKLSPQQIWEQMRDIVTDPGAQKEVWIVLGAGMSLADVRAELAKSHPADEMIQLYSLLQTAWSTAAQCGAQLRIFCSP